MRLDQRVRNPIFVCGGWGELAVRAQTEVSVPLKGKTEIEGGAVRGAGAGVGRAYGGWGSVARRRLLFCVL